MICTLPKLHLAGMNQTDEKTERLRRAERLVDARKRAGFRGPKGVSEATRIGVNAIKAHESGRNGFGISDAKAYARAFNVSLNWLNFGLGTPEDEFAEEPSQAVAVPLISWVSAGALTQPDYVPDGFDEVPQVYAPDLDPNGDWIALRVDGRSMDKISPHDSIIFVNRNERTLIPNACYIVGDGNGGATYKRFRPPNILEAVTTKPDEYPPIKFEQEPDVIGRVRKTVLAL